MSHPGRRHRALRALALSLLPSLGVHGAVLELLSLPADRARRSVRSVTPVELLDVRAARRSAGFGARSPGEAKPSEKSAHTARASAPALRTHPRLAVAAAAGAGRREKAEPAPPPPQSQPASEPLATDLAPDAPSTARLIVLLRADRLRRSPYRQAAEQLLETLPDYWSLLGGAGTAALDSFDSLLIATANPFDVTQTFLAARYHGPDASARQLLDRGARGSVRWTRYRDVPFGRRPPGPFADPRVLLMPLPGLVVLARPELVDALLANAAGTPGQGPEHGPASGPAAAPSAASSPAGPSSRPISWLDRLQAIESTSGGEGPGGPLLLATASDLPALLDRGDSSLLPAQATMIVQDAGAAGAPIARERGGAAPSAAEGDLAIDVTLVFRSPEDARRCADALQALRTSLSHRPGVAFAAGGILDLTPRVAGPRVQLDARVGRSRALLLLGLIRSRLPSPRAGP